MAMVLVVAGRVRRGEAEPCEAGVLCEECRTSEAQVVVVSKKGLRTWLCEPCLVACGPNPQPPRVGALVCESEQTVRAAMAIGWTGDSRLAFRLAMEWERDRRAWVKATTPHGFRRVAAKPKHDRAIWMPFA